jgi:hypothetical protein
MTPRRPTRIALILTGTLVLALGLVGFAVGRSMRTSKEQARTAARLSMARAFDASFQSAYSEADRSGVARGRPEGEALGRTQGAQLGRRHGELVKARRLLRLTVRRRARERHHAAHRPRAAVTPIRPATAYRRPPRKPRRVAHKPRRVAHKPRSRAQRERERESRGGVRREPEEGFPERRERATTR